MAALSAARSGSSSWCSHGLPRALVAVDAAPVHAGEVEDVADGDVQQVRVGFQPAVERLAGQRGQADGDGRHERPQPAAARAFALAAAGRADSFPASNAASSSLAGGFGGGVVADLVQQVAGEFLGAGADGAAAAAGDQRHQRREVPGAAGEQVVRQVVGDHARVRVGEHEVLLDGQQQLPPGPPARLGGDLERADAQGGPAAGVLGELFLPGGQALADQAAALQPDARRTGT